MSLAQSRAKRPPAGGERLFWLVSVQREAKLTRDPWQPIWISYPLRQVGDALDRLLDPSDAGAYYRPELWLF
jgi:hypothetical protein